MCIVHGRLQGWCSDVARREVQRLNTERARLRIEKERLCTLLEERGGII